MSRIPDNFNVNLRFSEFDESWEYPLLDSVAIRGSGHTPSKDYPEYYDGEIDWVSLADSKSLDRGYISATKTKISEKGLAKSSAVLHPAETVILSRDAGVGKSAVMKHAMAVSQHFIAWRPIDEVSCSWFLYYWLQIQKREFERIAIGSTIKTIGLPYFKKLRIPFPTLPEQKKIADFLTSVDERIGQLIKKKALLEDYKKGVMQQLFSQQIRFKDDNGNDFPDWEEKKLGDLCNTITKGATPTSYGHAYQEIGINFIKTENINKTGFIDTESTPKISDECHAELKRSALQDGDVLFSIAGTLGRTAIVRQKDLPANINQALGIIRLKDQTMNIFITYFLNRAEMGKWIHQMVSVGAQPNLSLIQLNIILVSLPSVAEQKKIADFLTSVDQKIERVSQQIAKTQTFKKGLLQQMFV
ncbi:restriction endonuclease subunit S [bacterium]|nr:restriction endonuclease subunit S [bacterium]